MNSDYPETGFSLQNQESARTQEKTAIVIRDNGLELEASSRMDPNLDEYRHRWNAYANVFKVSVRVEILRI